MEEEGQNSGHWSSVSDNGRECEKRAFQLFAAEIYWRGPLR